VLEFLARLRFSQRPAGVAPGARTLSSCLRTSASWATDRSLTEICVVAIGGQVNSARTAAGDPLRALLYTWHLNSAGSQPASLRPRSHYYVRHGHHAQATPRPRSLFKSVVSERVRALTTPQSRYSMRPSIRRRETCSTGRSRRAQTAT
jgi:hypothetical protein